MENKAKKELNTKQTKEESAGARNRTTRDGQDEKESLQKGQESELGSSVKETDLLQDINKLHSNDDNKNEAPQISGYPKEKEQGALEKLEEGDKKSFSKSTQKCKGTDFDTGPSFYKKYHKSKDSEQTDTKVGEVSKRKGSTSSSSNASTGKARRVTEDRKSQCEQIFFFFFVLHCNMYYGISLFPFIIGSYLAQW